MRPLPSTRRQLPAVPGASRRIAIVVLAAGLLHAAAARASEAPIRAVVLYPGVAVVQRVLAVPAGAQHVEVDGLPTDFDEDSLRLEGSAGLHLGQFSLKPQASVARPDPRAAQLEARIEALRDQQAALDVDAQAANAVRDLIGRLSLGGDKGAPVALDGRSLGGIFEQVQHASRAAAATIGDADRRKRELDQQIEAAGRDLAALQSGRRDTRVLAFDLAADRAGEVRISYPQAGAGWRPSYRAELDSASGRVTLQRQAQVHQRTGEDWSGVRLRLSTGRPQLAPSGPEPEPWLIRLLPQYPAMKARAFGAMDMAAAPASVPAPAPVLAQAPAAPPEVEEYQAPFATEFSLSAPVSLPSDGSVATLSLGEQRLDASLRLRTAPRLEAAAYVEAEARRPAGDWLPGSVQLVRDGDYVGQTQWQPQAGDKLLLPFGRDDLVRVRYVRREERSGSAGLLGQRSAREVTDEYSITSHHAAAMPLLVLEPAPVSADDQVKVQTEFAPAPDQRDWDTRNGVVAWQRSLQPEQTLSLRAHYTVSYPEDRAATGLP